MRLKEMQRQRSAYVNGQPETLRETCLARIGHAPAHRRTHPPTPSHAARCARSHARWVEILGRRGDRPADVQVRAQPGASVQACFHQAVVVVRSPTNNGREDPNSAEGLRRVFCVFAAVFVRHGAMALSGGMGRAEHAQSTLHPESLSQVQPTASPVRRQ